MAYLNHLGIINTLGSSKHQVVSKLLANEPQMEQYTKLFSGRRSWIGTVTSPLVTIPPKLAKYNCRNNRLLATAYTQIAPAVENLKQKYGPTRIAVILGTSTSGIAAGESALKYYRKTGKFPPQFAYIQQEIGSCSKFLAHYAGIEGIHYTISTACSSSSKALTSANRLLKTGQCDAVIAGGADTICELTLNGFDTLELLAETTTNPFSINRSGINIGEGAALFVLSREPDSIQLSGYGESSDGYHMTAPDPQGTGAKLAIQQALTMAKLKPADIGYINLHGTGTRKNDEMESIAVQEIFGSNTPCSSSKTLLGHTLGASGTLELGLCWLLLSKEYNPQQIIPPHLWDGQQDPKLARINLIAESTPINKPAFISNSFAFGGSNVALVITAG